MRFGTKPYRIIKLFVDEHEYYITKNIKCQHKNQKVHNLLMFTAKHVLLFKDYNRTIAINNKIYPHR